MSDFFVVPATGWINDPVEVSRVMQIIHFRQGISPYYSHQEPSFEQTTDDATVLFWKAEEKVLGSVLKSWNQGNVGSCVSFGWGRACQDLLLGEIAAGDMEEYPNAQVATEPIYGGSRVEVGGGRIGGDGSVGAWAAEWVRRWGILFRLKYGEVDLTSYNEKRCREYGRYGCPDELEPVAKEHPVQTVAMVRSGPEAWSAIGNWYPIPVCSNRGFTTTLREGFCEPSGNWNHCMTIRGKFVHPTKGKSFVIQNSWGGYLNGEKMIKDVHGVEHELPEGCFATTMNVVDAMMRQEDSFAISNFKGFPSRKLSWYI